MKQTIGSLQQDIKVQPACFHSPSHVDPQEAARKDRADLQGPLVLDSQDWGGMITPSWSCEVTQRSKLSCRAASSSAYPVVSSQRWRESLQVNSTCVLGVGLTVD